MKKVLKAVLIGFSAIIVFAVFQGSKNQKIQIVKTTTIKGSKKEVFEMVSNLKNFPKWSPFLVQDPTQKYEIKGSDGAVGSQYYWVGNKGEDVGYQEITKVDTFSFVGKKCVIQKPFVAKPTFDYGFAETPNGVEVREEFNLQSGLVDAFFLWAFGAKAEMEKTNQQGLDLLKAAIEK
jgi:hypothetical protein